MKQWHNSFRVQDYTQYSLKQILLLCLLLFSSAIFTGCLGISQSANQENPTIECDSLATPAKQFYTINANFELYADSILIQQLPVKDSYALLRKGDRVVVAEFATHPTDSIDSIWVKLAHSQEVQGWISESELLELFAPTNSISQAIYLFSHTHIAYFIIVFALFISMLIFRAFRRKQLQLVYFNDIDSIYPVLLCLLISFAATIYESMQLFTPNLWQYYYFNPTLSPFKTPAIISFFLLSLWIAIIVFVTVIDDSFRQLRPSAAIFYLLGLMSACIFCYFFFIITTHYYIGYLFMLLFFVLFCRRVYRWLQNKYQCGNCGKRIRQKGICPHCKAINE